jgi:hypothetical protein
MTRTRNQADAIGTEITRTETAIVNVSSVLAATRASIQPLQIVIGDFVDALRRHVGGVAGVAEVFLRGREAGLSRDYDQWRHWERQALRCPHQIEIPFTLGATVRFPAPICAACPLRERCTTSPHGRSVHIHPDEPLLAEFRARQQTPLGRAKLRERVAVEHTLAHVTSWQSRRARYRGLRKNLFDLRRCAVVNNLHILSHFPAFLQQAA